MVMVFVGLIVNGHKKFSDIDGTRFPKLKVRVKEILIQSGYEDLVDEE